MQIFGDLKILSKRHPVHDVGEESAGGHPHSHRTSWQGNVVSWNIPCIVYVWLHHTWAIRENILPFQDVIPRRLIYCSPQRSSDRKRRIVENRWLNKAGELTDLWRPGTQRHWERPQQPCRRELRMKAGYGCNKLTRLANTLASKKPAAHTHNSSQNNTLWMFSNVNMEGKCECQDEGTHQIPFLPGRPPFLSSLGQHVRKAVRTKFIFRISWKVISTAT